MSDYVQKMMEDLLTFYQGRISFEECKTADDIKAFWIDRYRIDPKFMEFVDGVPWHRSKQHKQLKREK